MQIEFFTNERFEMLKLLKHNQITVKEEQYVPLSQQEIADMLHMSKLKCNTTLNELIEENYITMKGKGKYALTDKANSLYKKLETI